MPTEKYNTFVPNLSPHSLRLIRKIFVDHNNSQDLIKDLESQVTIFDKISIDEHESFFMKFNKENISFQGTCSLLADLIAGGWRVGIGLEGFLISKPNYDKAFTGDNLKETKEKMRNVQKINRDKQIKSVDRFSKCGSLVWVVFQSVDRWCGSIFKVWIASVDRCSKCGS